MLAFLKKQLIFLQHLMMESFSLEEEKIIEDIRIPFRLKKN